MYESHLSILVQYTVCLSVCVYLYVCTYVCVPTSRSSLSFHGSLPLSRTHTITHIITINYRPIHCHHGTSCTLNLDCLCVYGTGEKRSESEGMYTFYLVVIFTDSVPTIYPYVCLCVYACIYVSPSRYFTIVSWFTSPVSNTYHYSHHHH